MKKLVLILAIMSLFAGCGGDKDTPEEPEFRSENITLSNGKTVIVEATTTKDEYAKAKNNTVAGFEYVLENGTFMEKGRINDLFDLGFTTVKVGNNVGSGKYEVTLGEFGAMNLDLNHVLTAKNDELADTLINAEKGMMGEGPMVGHLNKQKRNGDNRYVMGKPAIPYSLVPKVQCALA